MVGADVLLETLSSLLAQEAVSAHARGYVFDDQKRIIVHSDKAMMDLILESLCRRSTRQIGRDQPSGSGARRRPRIAGRPRSGQPEGTVSFMVGEQPYLAEISPVGFSGLVEGNTVVIAAPLSDFTGASVRLLQKALLISGILLAAGIVAALLVARLVSNSLSALTADARQIGDLEFNRPSRHAVPTSPRSTRSPAPSARRARRSAPSRFTCRANWSARSSLRDRPAGRQRRAAGSDDPVHRHPRLHHHLGAPFARRGRGAAVGLFPADERHRRAQQRRDRPVSRRFHLCDVERADAGPRPRRRRLPLRAWRSRPAIDECNAGNRQAGRPELVTRFGLHTGAAVVGSVGAPSAPQYTAMGDTVNVASRLEGIEQGVRNDDPCQRRGEGR